MASIGTCDISLRNQVDHSFVKWSKEGYDEFYAETMNYLNATHNGSQIPSNKWHLERNIRVPNTKLKIKQLVRGVQTWTCKKINCKVSQSSTTQEYFISYSHFIYIWTILCLITTSYPT